MTKLWSETNDLVKNDKSSGVKNNLVKNGKALEWKKRPGEK